MALRWPWWTIYGEDLMQMLRRVADGADPEQVYQEAYELSDHEHPAESS